MARMSDVEMGLAKVYASAILELAEGQGIGADLLLELRQLAAWVEENPQVGLFFRSLSADIDVRAQHIEKLFRDRMDDVLVDALQVMNRKGRLGLVREIAEAYRIAYEDRHGGVDVHLKSAVPLTEPLRAELREWSHQYSGLKPAFVETVDPALLGGFIIQIGDEKFDMSVSTRLASLRKELLERASAEIYAGRTYLEAQS